MLRLAGCSSGTGVCARGGLFCGARRRSCGVPGSMRFPRLCQERRASPPPWGSCRPQAFCSPFECVPAIGRRRAFLSECRTFISSLSCVSIGMSRVHLKPVARSYRNVARSSQACRAFLSECRTFISSLSRVPIAAFCVRSRLLFAALRQTGRLAVSCVPVPPGRDRQ